MFWEFLCKTRHKKGSALKELLSKLWLSDLAALPRNGNLSVEEKDMTKVDVLHHTGWTVLIATANSLYTACLLRLLFCLQLFHTPWFLSLCINAGTKGENCTIFAPLKINELAKLIRSWILFHPWLFVLSHRWHIWGVTKSANNSFCSAKRWDWWRSDI